MPELSLTVTGLEQYIAAEVQRQLAELVGTIGRDEDRWMDTRDAAAYLGLTPNALHKLTAARTIPFSQDVAGGKCWFLRSELDAWRHASPTTQDTGFHDRRLARRRQEDPEFRAEFERQTATHAATSSGDTTP